MTPATLVFLVAVLFVAIAMLEVGTRPAYSYPACGASRVNGHSRECPWGQKP
jgi:hypothetical protein